MITDLEQKVSELRNVKMIQFQFGRVKIFGEKYVFNFY